MSLHLKRVAGMVVITRLCVWHESLSIAVIRKKGFNKLVMQLLYNIDMTLDSIRIVDDPTDGLELLEQRKDSGILSTLSRGLF